jgi:hypothetical protein
MQHDERPSHLSAAGPSPETPPPKRMRSINGHGGIMFRQCDAPAEPIADDHHSADRRARRRSCPCDFFQPGTVLASRSIEEAWQFQNETDQTILGAMAKQGMALARPRLHDNHVSRFPDPMAGWLRVLLYRVLPCLDETAVSAACIRLRPIFSFKSKDLIRFCRTRLLLDFKQAR